MADLAPLAIDQFGINDDSDLTATESRFDNVQLKGDDYGLKQADWAKNESETSEVAQNHSQINQYDFDEFDLEVKNGEGTAHGGTESSNMGNEQYGAAELSQPEDTGEQYDSGWAQEVSQENTAADVIWLAADPNFHDIAQNQLHEEPIVNASDEPYVHNHQEPPEYKTYGEQALSNESDVRNALGDEIYHPRQWTAPNDGTFEHTLISEFNEHTKPKPLQRGRNFKDPTAHRHYIPFHPVCNKLLAKQWDLADRRLHLEKLAKARPTVDNAPPRIHMHLQLKLKRMQVEEDRIAQIERENRILLDKMSHIMKAEGNHKDYTWMEDELSYGHSLNYVSRQQEHNKIDAENQAILQRLESKEPHYDHYRWLLERRQNLAYLQSISTYPRRYIRLRKSMDTFLGFPSPPKLQKPGVVGETAIKEEIENKRSVQSNTRTHHKRIVSLRSNPSAVKTAPFEEKPVEPTRSFEPQPPSVPPPPKHKRPAKKASQPASVPPAADQKQHVFAKKTALPQIAPSKPSSHTSAEIAESADRPAPREGSPIEPISNKKTETDGIQSDDILDNQAEELISCRLSKPMSGAEYSELAEMEMKNENNLSAPKSAGILAMWQGIEELNKVEMDRHVRLEESIEKYGAEIHILGNSESIGGQAIELNFVENLIGAKREYVCSNGFAEELVVCLELGTSEWTEFFGDASSDDLNDQAEELLVVAPDNMTVNHINPDDLELYSPGVDTSITDARERDLPIVWQGLEKLYQHYNVSQDQHDEEIQQESIGEHHINNQAIELCVSDQQSQVDHNLIPTEGCAIELLVFSERGDLHKGVIDFGIYGLKGIPSLEPPYSLMTASHNRNFNLDKVINKSGNKNVLNKADPQSVVIDHGIYGIVGSPGISPNLSLMTGSKNAHTNTLKEAVLLNQKVNDAHKGIIDHGIYGVLGIPSIEPATSLMTGLSAAHSDHFKRDLQRVVIDYGVYGVLGIPSKGPPTSLMTGSSAVHGSNVPRAIAHQSHARGIDHGIYGVIGLPGTTPALSLMTGSKGMGNGVLQIAQSRATNNAQKTTDTKHSEHVGVIDYGIYGLKGFALSSPSTSLMTGSSGVYSHQGRTASMDQTLTIDHGIYGIVGLPGVNPVFSLMTGISKEIPPAHMTHNTAGGPEGVRLDHGIFGSYDLVPKRNKD
ncbi:hypothetical protein BJ742DRAFT_848715 [Cladochytrium replicatum]|nr:hypothetical protein BJ742DRAFT_848715 [Cladochytrium replicatum]